METMLRLISDIQHNRLYHILFLTPSSTSKRTSDLGYKEQCWYLRPLMRNLLISAVYLAESCGAATGTVDTPMLDADNVYILYSHFLQFPQRHRKHEQCFCVHVLLIMSILLATL